VDKANWVGGSQGSYLDWTAPVRCFSQS